MGEIDAKFCTLFTPHVKIRGGVDEMSESIFVLDLRPTSDILLTRGRCTVWEITGPGKQK